MFLEKGMDMKKNSQIYKNYVDILRKELVPAMGCTEPIAVAFCSAKAREVLGYMPSRIEISASGNIIKNVKSVIVPHSGGLRGLEAAAAVGTLYGDASRCLEVISDVTPEQEASVLGRMSEFDISVSVLDSEHLLDLVVKVSDKDSYASVRVTDEHTNIVEIVKDGELVFKENREKLNICDSELDFKLLTMADIFEFAETVDISDIKSVIERQIRYNTAISHEGMTHNYGARIGQLLSKRNDEARTQACAAAAAGSDARMSGCDMPVIICSGSGNQGMTASLPVITYAEYYRKSDDELYRALVLSNLVTLHLKYGIGRLSAYCGAVSAGAGAGAGIAYLLTKELKVINHTVVNALAISSGIICDGAKASCAAKIAMAVDAGIMGYEMYISGCQFYGGDGLVSKGVENTIKNISLLGSEGMKETDKKIIEIMTGCC